MNWYLEVLKKYAEFDGRARRKEYWYFMMFNVIIYTTFLFIDSQIGTFNAEYGLGLISSCYELAVFIPTLAVHSRRLHDTDRSGGWLLIALIPFGVIVLFVFTLLNSDPNENQYGPNPKGATELPPHERLQSGSVIKR